jgi:CubicO group peptidase (beta-lactamase class C family)
MRPPSHYIPEFTGAGKETITIRHLLTHTSGLPAGLPLTSPWSGTEQAIALACAAPLPNPPGTILRYSDVNFILLGEIVRRISGQSLDAVLRRGDFHASEMRDTTFCPHRGCGRASLRRTDCCTGRRKNGTARSGLCHPTEKNMFCAVLSTIPRPVAWAAWPPRRSFHDCVGSRPLCPTWLGRGAAGEVRLFAPANGGTASPACKRRRRFLRGAGSAGTIDSPYSGPRGDGFPIGSYGHTGWTGTIGLDRSVLGNVGDLFSRTEINPTVGGVM